ncbi:hypothetical protein ACHAXR_003764 [Thalassiosira sp. AJA248-18]
MALTEEQRKRMETNRKRALEIKRQKQIEKETNENKSMVASPTPSVFEAGGFVVGTKPSPPEEQNKKRRMEEGSENGGGMSVGGGGGGGKKECTMVATTVGGTTTNKTSNDNNSDDDESSLEDFELTAPPHITKTEAQRTYCIPLGTLAVCSFIEKDNPQNKGWSKMKLYSRAEVRRRARKRFGGKGGLREERERRRKKRFEKDLKEVENVFG